MNKVEAQQIVGKRVSAWTAASGVYVGFLKEIISEKGRPWRGVIEITGVLKIAQHFEREKICRRGFRPGESLEVGGINIKLTEAVGTDYKTLLEESIKVHETDILRHVGTTYEYVARGFAKAEKAILSSEIDRLTSGEWVQPVNHQ